MRERRVARFGLMPASLGGPRSALLPPRHSRKSLPSAKTRLGAVALALPCLLLSRRRREVSISVGCRRVVARVPNAAAVFIFVASCLDSRPANVVNEGKETERQ